MPTKTPSETPKRKRASGNPPKGVIPPAILGYQWKPGQSGNPNGYFGQYREAISLSRAKSAGAVERLGELMESADERVATIACNSIIERAWGKPKEYDPTADEAHNAPSFNPRDYTPEELKAIETGLRLMLRKRELIEARPVREDGESG